ncbi:adenosylcobinamide-GDP ribazoletransferase [Gloeobacter kilaueensis]|nr:adenosylcobinamide-GDP ribazoletransferase [Gloeobacter kilaueensis]
MSDLLAALVFYTALPLSPERPLAFDRIARWLPTVGLVVGVLTAGVYGLAGYCFEPHLAALIALACGWALTGGLHLDGLMDAADGWAAGPERRLAAMADSAAGAYAVMVAILVAAARLFALVDLGSGTGTPAIVLAAVTSRWGQLMAIGLYPYLKSEGKGRFLKDLTRWPTDGWFGTLQLVLVAGVGVVFYPAARIWPLAAAGCLVSLLVGWVIARHFGGHTGDTYGAVIEAAEALTLVIATLFV